MRIEADASIARGRLRWVAWFGRELAPFPGRKEMTIRLTVSVVLVAVISMTLQVPQLPFSAFFVFFVTKENRALTARTGLIMIVGATCASATSLLLYRYTFDYPEFRIPVMAGSIFVAMFLTRAFVIGPLGFVFGFFVALTQTIAEGAPNTDSLVRTSLWLWVGVVYPIALTIVINHMLLPADPWQVLVRALANRLDTAGAALRRVVDEGNAGGQTNSTLVELATRGSSPLLALLSLAEAKDPILRSRHPAHLATIAASEHLLRATASLEFREPQALTEEDVLCAKALLAEIKMVKTVLPAKSPSLPPRKTPEVRASLPQLREFRFAIESFRDAQVRYLTADATPVIATHKSRLFVADAFTNPSHTRFALKVTISAMICYLIYNGLNWPGISTAFVTCCFIALENTGATVRKGWLRLIGCAIGGLLGYFSIIFLIPRTESITSLILLTAAGSLITGWISAGTERISHAGLQAAFAFFMCVFQGFAPESNFTIVRDRLVGIFLGIVVSSLVYRYLWPEHAIASLRSILARVLRNLSQLIRIPKIESPIEAEEKAADALRGIITKDLDGTLRLSELVSIEKIVIGNQGRILPSRLEHMTSHTQALSLMTAALAGKTKLEEWQRLDTPAQQAESDLRASAADRLLKMAAFLEDHQEDGRSDLESTFAIWNRSVVHVSGNDRPRLVRRIVEEIKALP